MLVSDGVQGVFEWAEVAVQVEGYGCRRVLAVGQAQQVFGGEGLSCQAFSDYFHGVEVCWGHQVAVLFDEYFQSAEGFGAAVGYAAFVAGVEDVGGLWPFEAWADG